MEATGEGISDLHSGFKLVGSQVIVRAIVIKALQSAEGFKARDLLEVALFVAAVRTATIRGFELAESADLKDLQQQNSKAMGHNSKVVMRVP